MEPSQELEGKFITRPPLTVFASSGKKMLSVNVTCVKLGVRVSDDGLKNEFY